MMRRSVGAADRRETKNNRWCSDRAQTKNASNCVYGSSCCTDLGYCRCHIGKSDASLGNAGKCDLSRAIRNHGIALRDATRRVERDLGPARSRTISRRPRESRARAAPSGVRLQPLHGDERERARKGGRERRARPTRPRARASRRPRGAARRSEGARDRIDRTMLRRSSSPQRGPGQVLRRRVRRDRVRKGARARLDRRGARGLRAFAFTTARQ